jgi:NO-binding membrane sensor protein with MHYT domain
MTKRDIKNCLRRRRFRPPVSRTPRPLSHIHPSTALCDILIFRVLLIPTFFWRTNLRIRRKCFACNHVLFTCIIYGANQMVIVYQPVLVLLSIGVAIIGSLTSLALTSGLHDTESESWEQSFSLANGGLIMGTTIWAMHFIAMMAMEVPALINYNLVETTLSIGLAIGVTAVGLFVVKTRRFGAFSIPGAGVLMGLGIAGMHYLGMSAIRGCGLAYEAPFVAASLVIAITASTAALWFAFSKRNIVATLAGGVVGGFAVTSMHYTAMLGTGFVPPDAPTSLTTPLFSENLLAFMIAGAITVVCIGNLTLVGLMWLYPVHVTTRKFFGSMTRKLSVTESQNSAQLRGTLSRRKLSAASANWAQVA